MGGFSSGLQFKSKKAPTSSHGGSTIEGRLKGEKERKREKKKKKGIQRQQGHYKSIPSDICSVYYCVCMYQPAGRLAGEDSGHVLPTQETEASYTLTYVQIYTWAHKHHLQHPRPLISSKCRLIIPSA